VVGLTPDTGERQRGCSQRQRSVTALEDKDVLLNSWLIALLGSTATTGDLSSSIGDLQSSNGDLSLRNGVLSSRNGDLQSRDVDPRGDL